MVYFKIRIWISKILFWIAEMSLIKGHDSFFTQKEAWDNLSKLTHIGDERNKLKNDLENLRYKVGEWRLRFSWFHDKKVKWFGEKHIDIKREVEEFLYDFPEDWQPEVFFRPPYLSETHLHP